MAAKKSSSQATVAGSVNTQKTEIVLGKAAMSMAQSLSKMEEGITILTNFQSQIAELDLQIATKEDSIKSLDQEYKNKKEQAEIDLKLAIQNDELTTVQNVLKKNGLVTISNDQLQKLEEELSDLKANYQADLKKEVSKREAIVTAKVNSDNKLRDAEFATKEAQNQAKITMLDEKVKFLTEANTNLKDQLDKALENSVKIAEAASKSGSNITLGNSK